MDREYAAMNAAAYMDSNAKAPPETKPLESIAHAVNRINTAQVRISDFLDRWHGPQPTASLSTGEAGATQLVQPHCVSLERLFNAIDRLESRVEALNQIG